MASDNENILIKVDQNNLIYLDPNSVVSDGKIDSRNIKQENLVMYTNLEADLIPRTTLIANENKSSLSSIAKGTFNLMKSSNGDLDTTWTNAYNGTDIKNGSVFNVIDTDYDASAQSFGIDSINIEMKGGGVPRVTINFIDVRGKTLMESPENSPYKTFFHMPWPIFYLTIKGYYGKAIRYRIHLTKFTSKFNESNGNFEITTTFIGTTFAFLNDIPLSGILHAPYMFLSEQENTGKFNNLTGKIEKTISRSSKGFIMLQSVYNEYKEKGYLPKDFPVRTLLEVITIAKSIDKILEREIFDQKVDMRIFSGLKEFEQSINDFEKRVRSWGEIYLSGESFTKDKNTYQYLKKEYKDKLDIITAVDGKSLNILINNNLNQLRKNKLFSEKLIYDNKSTKSFEDLKLAFNNKITDIKAYYTQNGTNSQYGVTIENLINDIKNIKSSFLEQKNIVQTKVEYEINKIIRDKEKGLGFDPTIRNIFGVIMANADVYIRLLQDTHRKAFDVGNERKEKIKNYSDESIGDAIYPWPEIKKQVASTKQRVLAYPGDADLKKQLETDNKVLWPEIDFLENYHAVATKRLDTLTNKEGGIGNVSYIFENDYDNNDKLKLTTLFNLSETSPYTTKTVSSIVYEIVERARYSMLYETYDNDTIKEMVKNEFDLLKKAIDEDYEITNYINKISTTQGIIQKLTETSPYERNPYYNEYLPTVPYIKDITEQTFFIEQYSGSTKNSENNSLYLNLTNYLKKYKVESYRKDIYPFSSPEYLTYINKKEEINFNNILEVKSTEGLISSPVSPYSWVKDTNKNYRTNLFTQKLKVGKFDNGDNMLNTPYFHKQLFNDFNKTASYGKYVGSAYLLLNSMPFKALHDDISFNDTPKYDENNVLIETITKDTIKMSSLFNEIGASHYIPYHLMLKWGSMYHRYKTFLNDGTDILNGFLTSNITVPLPGQTFFDNNTTATFEPNNGISITYSTNDNIGIHPFYESVYTQIINDHGTYDVTSGATSYNSYVANSYINNRSRKLNKQQTYTTFLDCSKYITTNNYYLLLPSDGDNNIDYLNNIEFNNNEQGNFRIIWEDNNFDTVYSGKTFNTYNEELISNITESTFNNELLINEEFKKVFTLIGTFSPDILNKFEQYFIQFATEKIDNENYIDKFNVIKYTKFQDLLKDIVTIDKKEGLSDINDIINYLKITQAKKLKNITFDILSNSNLIKLTIGNPKEINTYVWSSLTKQHVGLNPKSFTISQITNNKKYLKLYVGDDDENDMYTKYLSFFSVNNIELNEENILNYRSLVYIFAGYIKKYGIPTKEVFQTYIRTIMLDADKRYTLFLDLLTQQFPTLKTTVKEQTLTKYEGFNEPPMKLELYNYFKSFNDRWISGNSIGQRLLIEEFLFLDKANKDIGDLAYLSLNKLIALEHNSNSKINLYSVISILTQGSGFNMMALPAYVNFYGANTTYKSMTSDNIANTLFGTFLDVDYQESTPKFILQYTGPVSHVADLTDINKNNFLYKNDSFNIADINNNPLIVTIPGVFGETDLSKSNRVVAFEVSIGDTHQSIFKSVQLDQESLKNTTESFKAEDYLSRSETGAATYQIDIGLFDIYRTRSYTCNVTCMGNVMIQPSMYFYLKNIPIFVGTYYITSVSHSIKNNNIVTNFTGVRISNTSLPDPKESFMAGFKVLFDSITNKAIAKQREADNRLPGATVNETQLQTSTGTYTIDIGKKENIIKGERLVNEAGVNQFGVRYNGKFGEKYIHLVERDTKKGTKKYFKAVITIMGGNNNPIDDDKIMNVINRAKVITIQSNSVDDPDKIRWENIKNRTKTNMFYSLRFYLDSTNEDKILTAKTTFYNPNDVSNKIVITPYKNNVNDDPTVTSTDIKGPINIGPNINGVGIAVSQYIAKKLNINEGGVIYFTLD